MTTGALGAARPASDGNGGKQVGPEDRQEATAGSLVTTDKVSVPRQGSAGRAAVPHIPLPRGAERRVLEVVPPVLEPAPTHTRQRHLVSTLLVVTADILA